MTMVWAEWEGQLRAPLRPAGPGPDLRHQTQLEEKGVKGRYARHVVDATVPSGPLPEDALSPAAVQLMTVPLARHLPWALRAPFPRNA
jgi:hypothetical protein